MTEQINNQQRNYYTDAMRIIEADEYTKHQYMQLSSAILGQEVTVVEILPNEDSSMMGTLIIMDILVRMSDGSLANIEVQKAPYLFPAERISCYSSDLMMRQYNKIKNMSGDGKKFSYKDLHRVHTIIFYENSSECLKSNIDEKLYFHVGKTKFNTGIDIELLQDFHLISLDTFREYRYPNIIQGNTTVTGYDCDESVYKYEISGEMKKNRLMFLSLFVTDTMDNMGRLLSVYPELEDIVRDMGQYLSRPEEVLNMFSESLRILDKNSMDLLIDEAIERAEKAEAEAKMEKARADRIEAEAKQNNIEKEKAQEEVKKLKEELAKYKQ